jgi:hypothetical protein
MKKRMQVTISEELKEKMDMAKDFYGGYSGLIEKAVEEFLTRPVEPYPEDVEAAESARIAEEWVDLDSLRDSIVDS